MRRWLLLGTLWATLPAFESLPSDPCLVGTVPETRLMGALIRHRFIGGAWRDTVRYRLRVGDMPGMRVPFPYVHHGVPMEFEIAVVDSAGNVSACWSNIARKDP